jgi:hypothetical protein
MITEEIKIVVNTGNSDKKVKDLGKGIDDIGIKSQDAGVKGQSGFGKIGNSIGGLSPALDRGISGMKGMLVQMYAILANPLGLALIVIVGALTLLFKAFTSTNEGADKLEQVMSGLSATVDIVRDRILNVANAIVKFFTGDFKGAMAEGKKAVSGFGDEVAREFRVAANAVKSLQEVEDAMRSLGESRARLDRDLARSKEIITDETASYKDKKKAIDEVRKAEGIQTSQELKNAEKKLKAIQEQNKQSDTSDEDLKKESDARIALFNLQQKSADDRRNINKQDKRADNEEKSRIKAIADERATAQKAFADQAKERKKIADDLAKQLKAESDKIIADAQKISDSAKEENLQKSRTDIENLKAKYDAEKQLLINSKISTAELDAQFARNKKAIEDKLIADQKIINDKAQEEKIKKEDSEFLRLQELNLSKEDFDTLQLVQKYEKEFALAEGNNALQVALKAKLEKDILAINKKSSQESQRLAQQTEDFKFGLANQTLNLLGGLAKKGSALAKGVAIGQAVISTYQGINKALAETTDFTPSQSLRFINAGLVGAAGFANVAKILSTKETGTGASPSGGGGGGQQAPSAPSFNLVQGTGANQIASSLGGQNQPVMAFVVSSAVTTAQALERNIISNSKF